MLLLVDLASDDGIDDVQSVVDNLGETRTRLAKESYVDEQDVGLIYTQTFLVPNKIDAPGAAERLELLHEFCAFEFPEFVISAQHGTGLEALRDAIYRAMNVVRVYTKLPTQKDPDFDRPYTIHRGGTLLEVAEMVHKDFATQLKSAASGAAMFTTARTSKGTMSCTTRTWSNCTSSGAESGHG